MGTYTNTGNKTYKPFRFLSIGNTYAEHGAGQKANTDSTPIGTCFKERILMKDAQGNVLKNEDGKNASETKYLFNYKGKSQSGYPIFGCLSNVKMEDKKMKDKDVAHLTFVLEDATEKVSVSIPLFNTKGDINKIAFSVVAQLLSADKYGFIIATPWLSENKSIKVDDKYISFEQLKADGVSDKWELWKEKYPKGKEEIRHEAKITFHNITDMTTEQIEWNLNQGNIKALKESKYKLTPKAKLSDLPPAKLEKVIDGEIQEINNSKKRNSAYLALVEELVKKVEPLELWKNNMYATTSFDSAPNYDSVPSQPQTQSEEQDDDEAMHDDLPF